MGCHPVAVVICVNNNFVCISNKKVTLHTKFTASTDGCYRCDTHCPILLSCTDRRQSQWSVHANTQHVMICPPHSHLLHIFFSFKSLLHVCPLEGNEGALNFKTREKFPPVPSGRIMRIYACPNTHAQ